MKPLRWSPVALKGLALAAAALLLVGTLLLYQQPGFMVNMADQLWSCF